MTTDIERYAGAIAYANSGDIVEDSKRIINSAQGAARTAVNVTGDAVVTCCVAQRNGLLDRSVFDADDPAPAAHTTSPAPQ